MDNKDEHFSYTYSPKQQEEISSILKKYIPQEESAIEKIRRLDRQAEQPGMAASLTVGIIGTLLLGVSMTCTIEWTNFFIIGIAVGVIGIALIMSAYPIFKRVTKRQRKKIAPQIVELSEKVKIKEERKR